MASALGKSEKKSRVRIPLALFLQKNYIAYSGRFHNILNPKNHSKLKHWARFKSQRLLAELQNFVE